MNELLGLRAGRCTRRSGCARFVITGDAKQANPEVQFRAARDWSLVADSRGSLWPYRITRL